MYVNVDFVIRCLYSAVSLTLVREQRFIRIIYYYYYVFSVSFLNIFICCIQWHVQHVIYLSVTFPNIFVLLYSTGHISLSFPNIFILLYSVTYSICHIPLSQFSKYIYPALFNMPYIYLSLSFPNIFILLYSVTYSVCHIPLSFPNMFVLLYWLPPTATECVSFCTRSGVSTTTSCSATSRTQPDGWVTTACPPPPPTLSVSKQGKFTS